MKKIIPALFAAVCCLYTFGETRPNIILILADDLGYGDVGFMGCTDIPTPHIDALATEGVRFTNGTVTHSFCSPSRAGIMAGRYQQRFGHENNVPFSADDLTLGLPVTEKLLPQALKEAGYTTAMFGKWHLGGTEPFHPLNRGFDELYGFLGGGHKYFPEQLTIETPTHRFDEYKTKLLRNRERVEETEHLTEAFTREACAFIERQSADKPFFIYLSYNAPHTPLQPSKETLERVPNLKGKRRQYAGLVVGLDDGVGRVFQTLEKTGHRNNTLIFFLSDNGGPLPHGADNGELRDDKGTVYEGGIRVPFTVSWPGIIPAGVDYEPVVSSLDIYATAAAVAGTTAPEERPLDGVNLIPYLTGEDKTLPHEILFWRQGGGGTWAARQGNLKMSEVRNTVELHDLDKDISESNDLSATYPEKLQNLKARLRSWNKKLVKPLWNNPTPPKKDEAR